jgi:uncharacterized protein YeeX (DUF496 family)
MAEGGRKPASVTDIWGSGGEMKIDEILVYVTHFRMTNKYIKEICGQHRKIRETEEQVIAFAAARSISVYFRNK